MTEGKIKYKRENFENIKDIFEKKTGANVRSGRKYGRLRIVAATAAAAALCIAAAIPAMAAGDAVMTRFILYRQKRRSISGRLI